MLIRCAEEKDFRELRQFYDRMCEVLGEKDFLPEGDKGGFPSDEMVKNAEDKEMVVLHALRVLPEYGGRGYSKQLVQHAIDTARERGLKSIRLDCIEGNDIPQKMYMSFGFAYVDTVEITYVDIGIPRKFLLYEFAL